LVPFYYLNRGNIYLQNKQYDKALNDYSYLLSIDSLSTAGLVNRGITYYQLGNKDNACLDWLKAKNLGASPGDKYYTKYCK
jgi:tetratricopeptide (TPR) repeat protein